MMKTEKDKKNKKNSNRLLELWKKVDSLIATIASIISIVVLFAEINIIVKYILMSVTVIYLMIVGIYVVKTIFDTSHAKAELDKAYYLKDIKLSAVMHKYYHNLRNNIASMDGSKILTLRDVEDKCQNICDYLSEFYNTLFSNYLDGYNVCVCIKLIRTDVIFDENYNNWTMETIARSVSTAQERFAIDRNLVKISENSDFQIILSSKYPDELFSFADMTNIKNDFLSTYGKEYTNSRGDDFLNYYRSTIVVPIKIDGRFASNELSSYVSDLQNRDLVLGFLCIDSMKIFDTDAEKNIFSVGIEYAKSFGDSLYLLFEKILLFCLENANMDKDEQITEPEKGTTRKQSSQKDAYNANRRKYRRRK